uniref:PNPLA domain-containing protein n=1 Tax=Periophthalmus magnuspinnatus TaxID=409849 RepID=A0A3B4B1T4_9GOBI
LADCERQPGWNLSFAGCGFRSVYYLGALSCLLERVPELVHGAARFSGASSGSLVASWFSIWSLAGVLVSDLVAIAMEARSLVGGVFSPSFSLQQRARDSLLRFLPLDAHVHASRRLCVSLTRVHDGKNLRVTDFRSREELIQVLLCSCFFPVYCGYIPPTYRGERYMDGALSDNQPLSELPNSLLFSPFSGESDICPKESGFFPVDRCFWQVLLQMCVNGYKDALRFLVESDQKERGDQEGGDQEREDQEKGHQEKGDQEKGDQEKGDQEGGDQEREDQEGGDQEREDQERGDQEREDQEGGDQEREDQERGDQEREDQEREDQERGDQEGGDEERGDEERGDEESDVLPGAISGGMVRSSCQFCV